MSSEHKKSFSNWLETLQQESWHLELLISGFAIFLLAGARESIDVLFFKLQLLSTGFQYFDLFINIPANILLGSWYVLLINLILHVILRGLWVSTIGLRYVSGDIDFKEINLSPKFDDFLRKKIVNFDLYINQLEKVCSSVFGFTFLTVFVLFSISIYSSIGGLLILILDWIAIVDKSELNVLFYICSGITIFYFLGGLLYFIDFITLGWIKRKKSISKFYFPLYYFFSIITLATIYRPLYYNLIDNRFGRKVILFLIPYTFVFFLYTNLDIKTHQYLPAYAPEASIVNHYYDDQWDKKTVSNEASLSSLFAKNGYIQLFLPYNATSDDNAIKLICPDLEPAQKGLFLFDEGNISRFNMNASEAMTCHSKRFKIYIDKVLLEDNQFWFHKHPIRKNVGLLSIIDVSSLKRGQHFIRVGVLLPREFDKEGNPSKIEELNLDIPFWTN